MESLALLVTLLIIAMLISGITALLLTFRKSKALANITLKPLQRIITIFLGLISFIIGLQFVTQVDSVGGRIIGGFGIATALIAFFRVFKR